MFHVFENAHKKGSKQITTNWDQIEINPFYI